MASPANAAVAGASRPSRKRLVVCCDGTWQSSVTGLENIPSNVTRLARSVARSGKDTRGQEWQQLVYYDAGIGTGVLSNLARDVQGGLGVGFVGNVIEAYNFIVLNYSPGDEVFCFGFSRGAYTARAVAGLVNDIGVISPKDMYDFPALYAEYQKHEVNIEFRRTDAYREWVTGVPFRPQHPESVVEGSMPQWEKRPHASAPERSRVVQVVGVFDTVGSLGIPELPWTRWNMKWVEKALNIPDPGFHNVALSPYIRHAFHALALDEHRSPFTPTLWRLPAENASWDHDHGQSLQEAKKCWEQDKSSEAWADMVDCEMHHELHGSQSELLQVWFPGYHVNCGGGDSDALKTWEGDFEQIALISFAWMCEQVAPYLQLDANLESLASVSMQERRYLVDSALVKMAHAETKSSGNWLADRASDFLNWTGLTKAPPKQVSADIVHGWATGPIIDSSAGAMLLAGSTVRTPYRYEIKQKSGIKYDESRDATREMIHPSVEYRIRKRSAGEDRYTPKALDGFTRGPIGSESDKGFEWSNGKYAIPEYHIRTGDVFSRRLASGEASLFLSEIDHAMA